MSRAKVSGKVCKLPEITVFGPDLPYKKEVSYMSILEYESIRLIDFIGLTQEKAAIEMDIARTTLQRIYYRAKHKLASALVIGKTIKIAGGNYRLCKDEIDDEKCQHCPYYDMSHKQK